MAQDPRTVARTYRAAIRQGEDYITVEETATLPFDATDEEIQTAVDTGLRIFTAQREAVEAQVAQIRASAPDHVAEEPASDGQRRLIDTLAQEDLDWTLAELDEFAAERGITDWTALTKRQASGLIDALKALKKASEPARRQPDPDQLARARRAQDDAHARVGLQQRPVQIRDPEAPASDAQIALIRRRINELGDEALEALAPRIAALFSVRAVTLRRLRGPSTWSELRDHQDAAKRLTKGRASELISLLNGSEERAAA